MGSEGAGKAVSKRGCKVVKSGLLRLMSVSRLLPESVSVFGIGTLFQTDKSRCVVRAQIRQQTYYSDEQPGEKGFMAEVK